MQRLAIVNASTVVSDVEGVTIVSALNQILPRFCSDWKLGECVATYVPKGQFSTIHHKIRLLDHSGVSSVFGYHDIAGNIPYGKCFAKTVLQNGGVLLYSENPSVPTVAQCVSHEVMELLFDPICNKWWDSGDGQTVYAAEVCDPVQRNTVVVTAPGWTSRKIMNGRFATVTVPSQKVGLSDWILPAWTDPNNTIGPYNYNNTLKAPFTIDAKGYGIQKTNGIIKSVFGSGVTDEMKAALSGVGRIC
jgi:hypothetical protein